jgi:hypothetical protein
MRMGSKESNDEPKLNGCRGRSPEMELTNSFNRRKSGKT